LLELGEKVRMVGEDSDMDLTTIRKHHEQKRRGHANSGGEPG
jgi:hypothetical protein